MRGRRGRRLSLAERAATELRGPDQSVWLDRLDLEYGNLQAALRHAVTGGDAELLLRLAGALVSYWQLRGLLTDGQHWMGRALAVADRLPRSIVAPALTGATRLTIARGEWAAAAPLAEANLQLWRDMGDRRAVAEALADLASVRITQAAGSREARTLARESVALARESGDLWTRAYAAHSLGEVMLAHANYQAARGHFDESLRLARQVGDRVRIALALEGLAVVAVAARRSEVALRLGGAAAQLRETLRAPLPPAVQAWFDARLAPARTELGDAGVVRAWAEGHSLPLEDVLSEDVDGDRADVADIAASTDALRWLTRREREVTALVGLGLRNHEIGERLGITRHTAEVHVSKILAKLGMGSRAQLAVWAVGNGLVQHT